MIKSILSITVISLMLGCHQSSDASNDFIKEDNAEMATSYEDIEPPRNAEPPPPPRAGQILQDQSSKNQSTSAKNDKAQRIIKTGRVTVDVADLKTAKSTLDLKIKSLKGYYESENFHDGSYNLAYHLAIRIPNEGFEELMTGLDRDFGQILSKEINARDVTEEYIDLGLRLESKLAALSAYRQFLKRATNVDEILKIQREIRQIEEEIEAKQGRLRYLDDQIAYSTLRVTLSENRPVVAKADSRHFGQQISNAFISGYDGILDFIIAMAFVWPLWIVLGVVALVWRRYQVFRN